jgi:predicted nuclease of predicted toxin-antitoxin system
MPRFLIDADIRKNREIVDILNEAGIETIRVHDIEMRTADDAQILDYAVREGFVLVTANVKDFSPMMAGLLAEAENILILPGVIYVPGKHHENIGRIMQAVIMVHDSYEGQQVREWWA